MFTVLSNTRNSNLYIIIALAAMVVVFLTIAVVPSISAPEPVLVPVAGAADTTSDYYQRHPDLIADAVVLADTTGDFYLRHPEWSAVTSIADNLKRPGMACESPVDCR